jgi:integrase
MAKIKLRFVQAFVANGRPYYYFRKPGCARVKLPGVPGSEPFMAVYQAALAADAPPSDIGAKRNVPGTVAALVAAYGTSSTFRDLAAETRRSRWVILRHFGDEHGDKRVAMLKREHVEAMLRNKRPFPRQNFLKALRPLLQFAVSIGWCSHDPTRELRATVKRGPGFRPWGEEQIQAFRALHPLGSRARLAFELLLGTVQRRADVVRIGPQHVRDGLLHVTQQKTGAELEIPVLPELQAALDATPSGHLTFLTTKSGKPFSAAGFGEWFHDRCNEVGLQGFSAHGLRHTGCTRLADAGCTGHEIAAWSGHRTLREVSRYTQKADQRALARAGETKLATSLSKPASLFDKSGKKVSTNKG